MYDLVNGKCVRKSGSNGTGGTSNGTGGTSKSSIPIAAIAGGAGGLLVVVAIIVIAVKFCKAKPQPSIATSNIGGNLSNTAQQNNCASGTTLTVPQASTQNPATQNLTYPQNPAAQNFTRPQNQVIVPPQNLAIPPPVHPSIITQQIQVAPP